MMCTPGQIEAGRSMAEKSGFSHWKWRLEDVGIIMDKGKPKGLIKLVGGGD